MALYHSPRIVTDGLVLCLDAANPKSYPGSGDVWYDLSGNQNHVTKQNSGDITYNSLGYFSTGATGYFNRASGTNIPTGNEQYCIGVWARQPTTWGTNGGLISIGGYGVTSQSNALRTLNNIAGQFHHYWWANDLSATSSSATINNWFMVLAQFDGSARSIYVNGINVASDNPVGHNVTSSEIQISKTVSTEYQQGDIAIAFIYNKALSHSEIIQNFNTLKTRYNL